MSLVTAGALAADFEKIGHSHDDDHENKLESI